MTYDTPQALRVALEQRLLNQSNARGVSLDRLRRRVVFERIVARLQIADPGRWVLKGGMALEVRLRDDARLTRDIDLGLRDSVGDAEELHERLVDALSDDPCGDRFEFAVKPVARLIEDGGGHATWRTKVAASLAGKVFGVAQVDVSPRAHELSATQTVSLPNSLDFAGIASTEIEIIEVGRHAGEKFHAMTREYGHRDNSRVRDLVDLVILVEHHLLDARSLAPVVTQVWREREGSTPPAALPSLPDAWPDRYERMAAEQGLEAMTFDAAMGLIVGLWTEMFPTKQS